MPRPEPQDRDGQGRSDRPSAAGDQVCGWPGGHVQGHRAQKCRQADESTGGRVFTIEARHGRREGDADTDTDARHGQHDDNDQSLRTGPDLRVRLACLEGLETPNLLIRRRIRPVQQVVSPALVAGQVWCVFQQPVANLALYCPVECQRDVQQPANRSSDRDTTGTVPVGSRCRPGRPSR